jgi:hypothetical protein
LTKRSVVALPPGGSDPLHGWGSAKAALDEHIQKAVNTVIVITTDIARTSERTQQREDIETPHFSSICASA